MSDHPATIGAQFGQNGVADLYRDVQLPLIFAPWASVLFETVPTATGDVVLDLATGPGTIARPAAALAGPSGRVTGVDVSAAMLANARSWPKEPGSAPIDYVEGSADGVMLPDASVDVAYCQHGLQWMTDPQRALENVHRMLKAGGRLGVAIWTRAPFEFYRGALAELGITVESPRPSSFGRDIHELTAALTSAGFQHVHVGERELVTPIAGMDTAIQAVGGTGLAATMSQLSESQQRDLRGAVARSLAVHEKDGVVHLPSAVNLASARK